MRRGVILSLVCLLFLSFGVSVFVFTNLNPVSTDTATKNFVINQGDGISSISLRLEKFGIIRNRYVFMALAYKMGLNQRLQAGLFRLSPSQSTTGIITRLSSGGSQDYWLKIIDGQRLEELSVRFDKSFEGYIFPDSYLIPESYTPVQIYEVIKKNFDQKFTQAKSNATNTNLTDSEIVILASLLEREGRSLMSKQVIAGILLNRLSINMALQIDATVQYARDSRLATKNFWQPVNQQDLNINSPYNTYKYPNLPPGPICNPGYDSIFAAFHPTNTDYMYYITGTDGQMHYAKTLDEHNANIAKYLK